MSKVFTTISFCEFKKTVKLNCLNKPFKKSFTFSFGNWSIITTSPCVGVCVAFVGSKVAVKFITIGFQFRFKNSEYFTYLSILIEYVNCIGWFAFSVVIILAGFVETLLIC